MATERRTRVWIVAVVGGLAGMVILVAILWIAGSALSRIDLSSGTGEGGGAGKGTDSLRLPIAVHPATGLQDGTVVTVTSDAFDPESVVGVALCLRAADMDHAGVDACDTVTGARYATDANGELHATFPVPRVITVDGRAHDCAAPAERCLLVAADASDFNRSGAQPISFRDDLPSVVLTPRRVRAGSDRLPISGSPTGPVPPNSRVRVEVSGFQPGEPLLVARCAGFPTQPPEDVCQPLDRTASVMALVAHSLDDVSHHADADGRFTVSVAAAPVVRPIGGADLTRCDVKPGSCTIVVAAAADTERSAVLPYAIANR